MNRAALVKTARTLVNLRHRLAADRELNDLLPRTVAEFDAAVAGGELRSVEEPLARLLEGK